VRLSRALILRTIEASKIVSTNAVNIHCTNHIIMLPRPCCSTLIQYVARKQSSLQSIKLSSRASSMP